MKILVNAASCVIGGGVQVATSFIINAMNCSEHQWLFAVSSPVMDNLTAAGCSKDKRIVKVSPAPSLPIKGRHSRATLRRLENDFNTDVVFTVFGPAYVGFKATHICGFAVPSTTHPNREMYNVLTFRQKIKMLLLMAKDKIFLRKKDFYMLETTVARKGLARYIGFPIENAVVIHNTYAPVFTNARVVRRSTPDIIKLLTLSGYYRHKNLEIIPSVALELKRMGTKKTFVFTLTLPHNQAETHNILAEAERLGVSDMIVNRGPVSMTDCPNLYNEHDFVFMPTLLETFSATYPEAMKMERPIITTNLDFARDICRDSASYYSPMSPLDAARKIMELAQSQAMVDKLIAAGRKRLNDFPTPEEKFKMQLSWILQVVDKTHSTGNIYKANTTAF
jgi:glycosyltransferase involved in cell wall biosynthesis